MAEDHIVIPTVHIDPEVHVEPEVHVKPEVKEESKVTAEIIRLDFTAEWCYKQGETTDHTCNACRGSLMMPPKTKTSDKLYLGHCGHAFHASCIDAWIANGSPICPIDRTPWTLLKELDNKPWKRKKNII